LYPCDGAAGRRSRHGAAGHLGGADGPTGENTSALSVKLKLNASTALCHIDYRIRYLSQRRCMYNHTKSEYSNFMFSDKDFVHMEVSAPFTFGFLKISDSHISLLSRIMTLNM
jgi:hypothetical protein